MIPRVAPLIDETEAVLRQEFGILAVARDHLPMLMEWGVEDFSETVHSMGMNYLTSIGKMAGRIAVSEYPVRLVSGPGTMAEGPSFIRPDVVWWDRASRQAVLIGEFERYEVYANKRQALTTRFATCCWPTVPLAKGHVFFS